MGSNGRVKQRLLDLERALASDDLKIVVRFSDEPMQGDVDFIVEMHWPEDLDNWSDENESEHKPTVG